MNARWSKLSPVLFATGLLAVFAILLSNQPATAWNGSTWSMPYSGSASTTGNAFEVDNTGSTGAATGVYGSSGSSSGFGVYGTDFAGSGNAYGVYGISGSTGGIGTAGINQNTSGTATGVYGASSSQSGNGGYFINIATTGNAVGVAGTSSALGGMGVYGSGGYGVFGTTPNSTGFGVYGTNPATSNNGAGVYGTSASGSGYGVYGTNTAAGSPVAIVGFLGNSNTGAAIEGANNSSTGTATGVYGTSGSSSGYGVYALNLNGGYGLYAASTHTNGYGVYSTGGSYGVYGNSSGGTAVYASSTTGTGVSATSNSGDGVDGTSSSANGVKGTSASGNGVYGTSSATANSNNPFAGVYGANTTSHGYAGYFNGAVYVSGPGEFTGDLYADQNLTVTGSITAGTKDFKIDHPLDPANKYLVHSSVESDEMMTIYRGNVVLDSDGRAIVQMPDWFQAINRDCSYQLTCIGDYAPVYIARKMENNYFEIAGGKPGLEVSWELTGVRQDAYAKAHPLIVEQDKGKDRGKYLHPLDFGKPKTLGIFYREPVHIAPPSAPVITRPPSKPPIPLPVPPMLKPPRVPKAPMMLKVPAAQRPSN